MYCGLLLLTYNTYVVENIAPVIDTTSVFVHSKPYDTYLANFPDHDANLFLPPISV